MEESVVLSNIATIISKDILIDESNNLRRPKHFLRTNVAGAPGYVTETPKYPLLESDDDEAFTFFLRQQQILPDVKEYIIKTEAEAKREHKPTSSKRSATSPSTTNRQKSIEAEGAAAKRRCVKMETAIQKRIELNLLNEFVEPALFESYLHLSKMTFLKIFQSMRNLLMSATFTIQYVTPQTVFSLSLWKLTTDQHFEEIAQKFQIPIADCHLIIRQFWELISDHYEAFIRWPNSQQTQQATLDGFQSQAQLQMLCNLFGIVACKRLDIFLESEDDEVAVVLQIICNADQKIIDCFVEYAQDYSFDASPIGQTLALNPQTIPAGSYLVGDSSFPLKHYLIRPFDAATCFRHESAFNRRLEPALALAQHVLDAMAKRFHTLYALEAKDLVEVRKIVETVCALHNLCVEIEDDYVERSQCDAVDRSNWYINAASGTEDEDAPRRLQALEQNLRGIKRRCDLMDAIVSTNSV